MEDLMPLLAKVQEHGEAYKAFEKKQDWSEASSQAFLQWDEACQTLYARVREGVNKEGLILVYKMREESDRAKQMRAVSIRENIEWIRGSEERKPRYCFDSFALMGVVEMKLERENEEPNAA